MSLYILITTFIASLGVTPSQMVGILTALGCVIPAAKDVRLGLIFLFLLSAVEFMVLYAWNLDTTLHVIMIAVSFTLMTISLFISHKKTQSPFEAI